MTNFLGREEEMKELRTFLDNPSNNIFGLYGVPMIGKSLLVNEFLDQNNIGESYNIIEIKFQNPENPQETLINELLDGNALDDLSFEKPTLIYIQNFEECLVWSGDLSHLHNVGDKFPLIGSFLQKANSLPNIKLIIESRFQINKFALGIEIQTLKDIELKGIDTKYFKEKYLEAGVSEEEFEVICKNFGNHTWLLSKAYEEREWLFKNVLKKAASRPKTVTSFLWDLLERVISRLYKSETLIMCALTLKNPIHYEDLEDELETLSTFQQYSVGRSIDSLERKFLIQDEYLGYEINPYLREVCFTFMKRKRNKEIALLKEIAFFSVIEPNYNDAKQFLDRGNFGGFYKEVHQLQREQKYQDAHNLLNYAFEYNDVINKTALLNEIARTYKLQKKYDEAIKIFSIILEKETNNVKTLNELGIIYKLQNKYEKAIVVLGKAIELGNIRSYTELAIIYKQQKKYDKAIEVLEEALEINPNEVKLLNELAIIYKEQKKYDEAIDVLEKALKINPNDAKTLNELAIIYKEQKKYDEAILILEKALNNNPNDVKTLNELAIIYKEQNKYDKAIEILEKILKINSKDDKSLNVLGIVYKHQKNYQKAIKTFNKSIELGNIYSYTQLAIVYRELGSYDEALEVIENGLKVMPNDKYLEREKSNILKAKKVEFKLVNTRNNSQKSPKKRLKKLISDNRLNKFIKEYNKIAEEMGNEKLQNSLSIHAVKLKEITNMKDLGTINIDKYMEMKIPIVSGLLALLKHLD